MILSIGQDGTKSKRKPRPTKGVGLDLQKLGDQVQVKTRTDTKKIPNYSYNRKMAKGSLSDKMPTQVNQVRPSSANREHLILTPACL